MRRRTIFLTVIGLGFATFARAQGTAPSPSHTYVEFTVGPTFGHNTDSAFGVEAGFPLGRIHIFAEGGVMRNVTSSSMEDAAITITTPPSPIAGGSFTLKQQVGYGAAGVAYNLSARDRFVPYVLFGVGAARVTKKNRFFVGGNDVTDQLLDQYGVQLGSDLAGHQTKAFIETGGGTRIAITDRFLADASYRYGHVFINPEGLHTHRLQFGIGYGF